MCKCPLTSGPSCMMSENYKKNHTAACETQTISSIFANGRDETDKVIYAEIQFVMFVAKSNKLFNTGICDGLSDIVGEVPPDGELTRSMELERPKLRKSFKARGSSYQF